ncbi:MAG: hypothetical protein WCT31_00785 [Candidatus Micrarchaeia archaeon]|jgi:hypothetical protein
MKIPLSKTKTYDLKDFIAKVYVKKKGKNSFNAIFVECKKRHYRTKLTGATRLYFVISGSGNFIINGKKERAKLYDLFVITDKDIYEYNGKMKLIEVNVPATGQSNEKRLE